MATATQQKTEPKITKPTNQDASKVDGDSINGSMKSSTVISNDLEDSSDAVPLQGDGGGGLDDSSMQRQTSFTQEIPSRQYEADPKNDPAYLIDKIFKKLSSSSSLGGVLQQQLPEFFSSRVPDILEDSFGQLNDALEGVTNENIGGVVDNVNKVVGGMLLGIGTLGIVGELAPDLSQKLQEISKNISGSETDTGKEENKTTNTNSSTKSSGNNNTPEPPSPNQSLQENTPEASAPTNKGSIINDGKIQPSVQNSPLTQEISRAPIENQNSDMSKSKAAVSRDSNKKQDAVRVSSGPSNMPDSAGSFASQMLVTEDNTRKTTADISETSSENNNKMSPTVTTFQESNSTKSELGTATSSENKKINATPVKQHEDIQQIFSPKNTAGLENYSNSSASAILMYDQNYRPSSDVINRESAELLSPSSSPKSDSPNIINVNNSQAMGMGGSQTSNIRSLRDVPEVNFNMGSFASVLFFEPDTVSRRYTSV